MRRAEHNAPLDGVIGCLIVVVCALGFGTLLVFGLSALVGAGL